MIFIAGHKGLVGSHLMRKLVDRGEDVLTATRDELDLTEREPVFSFFEENRPRMVYLAAAKVGGIKANTDYPVDFLLQNLKIQNNILEASLKFGVRKILFLGSSCIYPKLCPQPIKEEYLMTGALEPTNRAYAIAKIAGIELCQALRRQHGLNAICVMPTNLYGPGDNFHPLNSHVLPALIRRIHEAYQNQSPNVYIWGDGTPRREFLHVADLADACLFLMDRYNGSEIINIGTGQDLSIAELARLIAKVVGFEGEFVFDSSKPNGTPRKVLNIDRIQSLGWKPSVELEEGIRETYKWFLANMGKWREA